MRFLLGLRIEPNRVEVDELAVEPGLFLGPERLHGEHALAQQLEAGLVLRAVVRHLLDVPAAADRKFEAATRELIEAGDGFRGDDRVVLRHQTDAGPDAKRARRRRREGERDEGIVSVLVAFRQLAAAWERRAAAYRDMRVLADKERVE